MINNILNKISISGKISIFPLFLSFFYNYKLYNENNILKKEKSEMYLICKKSINDYIKYINYIKSK